MVEPGDPLTLVPALAHREPLVDIAPAAAWELVAEDEARWQVWSAEFDDGLPFRDTVVRSLITLRLLTYSPSGAPVAAPTTPCRKTPAASGTGTTATPGPATPASE